MLFEFFLERLVRFVLLAELRLREELPEPRLREMLRDEWLPFELLPGDGRFLEFNPPAPEPREIFPGKALRELLRGEPKVREFMLGELKLLEELPSELKFRELLRGELKDRELMLGELKVREELLGELKLLETLLPPR